MWFEGSRVRGHCFLRARPHVNAFTRRAFPVAIAFDTPEKAMADVVVMKELLLTTECMFLTLVRQYESALRDLNGYTTTCTAHLFTDTQFDFVLKFKPAILVYEMTPPKGGMCTRVLPRRS